MWYINPLFCYTFELVLVPTKLFKTPCTTTLWQSHLFYIMIIWFHHDCKDHTIKKSFDYEIFYLHNYHKVSESSVVLQLFPTPGPPDGRPAEHVEEEEEDGEDDEECEVGDRVVVLLPPRPVQLFQLHLEQIIGIKCFRCKWKNCTARRNQKTSTWSSIKSALNNKRLFYLSQNSLVS